MNGQIKYPRRVFIRQSFRLLGRFLLPFLADIRISGKDNFPQKGPLIVVGNHTAAMETVLMSVYSPRVVEYMGSTDIPHEKLISLFINAYGFIPVFRGNASPSSLKAGVEVLTQKGVLGIFPEGGIWEPSIRRAQSGVAWLSYHARAPVLPIGFGSMQGALKKVFALQRPALKMNVGELIPPVVDHPGKSRKQHFQDEANRIMDSVWELLPNEERVREQTISGEHFELLVEAKGENGSIVPIPAELSMQNGPAFSKFTHRKTLINNFILNLKMPEVSCLARLAHRPPLEEIIHATGSLLDHLEKENPYYFTYRYGHREGRAMGAGIREVHHLALWARDMQLSLHITPVRRFKDVATGQEVILERPEEFIKW